MHNRTIIGTNLIYSNLLVFMVSYEWNETTSNCHLLEYFQDYANKSYYSVLIDEYRSVHFVKHTNEICKVDIG